MIAFNKDEAKKIIAYLDNTIICSEMSDEEGYKLCEYADEIADRLYEYVSMQEVHEYVDVKTLEVKKYKEE